MTHFRTRETGIQVGDTEACLIGVTRAGVWFTGCDSVTIRPSKDGKSKKDKKSGKKDKKSGKKDKKSGKKGKGGGR